MSKKHQLRLLPWHGSDLGVAGRYAEAIGDAKHVTIPFAGGLSIVRLIVERGAAQEIVCSDLHKHAINLYRVIASRELCDELLAMLDVMPFHETVLLDSQRMCWEAGDSFRRLVEMGQCCTARAASYFVTAWMGRGGKAGTDEEFKGGLPIRMNANGGASPKRFRTAVESVRELWHEICAKCGFKLEDAFQLLERVTEADSKRDLTQANECCVYLDPPWVDDGINYVHKFDRADHVRLREVLSNLRRTRIVLRYGDHPWIRELYHGWKITELASRSQSNGQVNELLIERGDIT